LVTSNALEWATVADGQIHSLAVTWDSTAGAWELYLDGNLIDSGTGAATGTSFGSGGTLLFGQEQDFVNGGFSSSQVFSGTLYNARFFSDIRTSGEIAASYTSALPHDESGMLAQWEFDNLSSEGGITESVSGNDLTVNYVTEAGFTASNPSLTLGLDENSVNGSVVGTVTGFDIERQTRIQTLLDDYSAETGSFYRYVDTGMDWSTAFANATGATLEGVSGNLITIESATENQLALDILNQNGAVQAYIGASDSVVEGEWYWYDAGSPDAQFPTGTERIRTTRESVRTLQKSLLPPVFGMMSAVDRLKNPSSNLTPTLYSTQQKV